MFRIKTDIRQYRCKNREKVERLIRNWVIRPTDLIYDREGDRWKAIGEHPVFVELFASLDAAHQSQPDTVVTAAAEVAAEDRLEADREQDCEARATPTSGVLRRSRPPRRAAALHSGEKNEAEPTEPEVLQPPVPSDDVEGVIRDSDEITMMTEKTLELLSVEETPAEVEEETRLIERPDFGDADDDEVGDDEEETLDETLDETSGASEPEARKRPVSRQDLPEEVFATAELPMAARESEEPEEDEAAGERLDELSQLDDASDVASDDEEDMGSPGESRSRWNIVLDEMGPPDESEEVDDELDESDELDETMEFIEVSDPADQEDPEDQDDTLDLTIGSDRESEEAGEEASEEASEEAEPEAEAFDIDDDALDEAIEDLESAAIAAREAAEDLEDLPEVEVTFVQNLDMVSAGYDMEFPFPIEATAEIRETGVLLTAHSERKRDGYFSQPYPKKSGTLITTSYDTSKGPSSLSVTPKIIIAVAVAMIIVLALIAFASGS